MTYLDYETCPHCRQPCELSSFRADRARAVSPRFVKGWCFPCRSALVRKQRAEARASGVCRGIGCTRPWTVRGTQLCRPCMDVTMASQNRPAPSRTLPHPSPRGASRSPDEA